MAERPPVSVGGLQAHVNGGHTPPRPWARVHQPCAPLQRPSGSVTRSSARCPSSRARRQRRPQLCSHRLPAGPRCWEAYTGRGRFAHGEVMFASVVRPPCAPTRRRSCHGFPEAIPRLRPSPCWCRAAGREGPARLSCRSSVCGDPDTPGRTCPTADGARPIGRRSHGGR